MRGVFRLNGVTVGLFAIISLGTGCCERYKVEAFCRTNPHLFDEAGQLTLVKASVESEYFLVDSDEPVELFNGAPGRPVATAHLRRGEQIGFRRRSGGEVVAVAGDREIPLQGRLRVKPSTDQHSRPGAPEGPYVSYAYQWCRRVTGEERAFEIALLVVLFPLMWAGSA